jgi:hypothetical protein
VLTASKNVSQYWAPSNFRHQSKKAPWVPFFMGCKMFRPVVRATGAHPGIAKLLAMLKPASPSVPSSLRSNVKKQQDSCFSQLQLP